jgi:hypothetical protein
MNVTRSKRLIITDYLCKTYQQIFSYENDCVLTRFKLHINDPAQSPLDVVIHYGILRFID